MKDFMIGLARECGKIMLEYRSQKYCRSFKGKKDIVTEIDLRVERLAKDMIKKNFPDHSIISEESEKQPGASGYTWIIDPLDGTMNYSLGLPYFAVSIALAKDGTVVNGVVYLPALDEMFYAEKGFGSYLNDVKVSASKVAKLAESALYLSTNPRTAGDDTVVRLFDIFTEKCMSTRCLGSCASELCYVAAGRGSAIVKPMQHEWDYAAGMLILEEAGGKVTDFSGNSTRLLKSDLAGTNSLIHGETLSAIKGIKRQS